MPSWKEKTTRERRLINEKKKLTFPPTVGHGDLRHLCLCEEELLEGKMVIITHGVPARIPGGYAYIIT